QQHILDAITATRTDIDASAVRLARLQAQHADSTQIAAEQTKLDSLKFQYYQLQITLSTLQLDQVEQNLFLHVVTPAVPSALPDRSFLVVNLAAGLSLGLLFGLLLVLVRDRLDQRLRTAAAVSGLLGVPVLAALPENVGQFTAGASRSTGYQVLANSLEFLS